MNADAAWLDNPQSTPQLIEAQMDEKAFNHVAPQIHAGTDRHPENDNPAARFRSKANRIAEVQIQRNQASLLLAAYLIDVAVIGAAKTFIQDGLRIMTFSLE